MLKWAVTVTMVVLLALPLCAQEKNAITAYNWNATSENSVAATSTGRDFSIAPASSRLFAMPAAAGKPADIFSDWANNPWNRGAWGRLTPRFEFAGLFSYNNFSPGSNPNFNNYGATGSFAYNANNWLGLVAEVGGYTFSRNVYVLPPGATQEALSTIKGDQWTYLFGPRLNFRHFDRFVPFAEVLFGNARGNPNITGDVAQGSFGMALGGGVDVVLARNIAWRFVQADYLMTDYSGPDLGASARQNNFRIGSGIVFRWDYPPAPPEPNHPPVAACAAAAPSVYQGSTDPVAIHVIASDPDNDPLTYSYTATGGTIDGTGPDVRWNPTGLALGSYTINVKVDDGRGGTATCAADVAINKRPNRPPVISCAPERNTINAGEHVAIKSTASDPDGDPITYSYATSGGQITCGGPEAQFDSTGLATAGYTITCTADDGRGGRTSATTTVNVVNVQAPAELERRLALHSIYFPTDRPRIANPYGGLLESQQKRLDSLAADFKEYLGYKPNAHLTMTGHADKRGSAEYNLKLSERRVEAVRHYLVERGVAADHLDVKALGDEQNLTADQVKALIEQSTTLSDEVKRKILKDLPTIVLANNRRVDLTLSTTGQQSVLGLPFNAEDASELISRTAPPVKGAAKAPAKLAPKKAPKP